jgi:signal transduction histidine kinase
LIGIQERLNAVGGTLSIHSAPGRGTKLLIRLPLEDFDGDSRRSRR